MNIVNLMGRGSEFHRLSALGNLGEVSDEVFKDVEERKVAIVVEVYVHHVLGI